MDFVDSVKQITSQFEQLRRQFEKESNEKDIKISNLEEILKKAEMEIYNQKSKMKMIESLINNYREINEDTDLLTKLNSVVNDESPRLITEDDIKLSNEIITIFNNQYKTDVFEKIKLNVTITTIERSKIDCFTLSIAVISQCKDMASLEQLSGYIIGYLDEFSGIDKINSTILRMVQICLYALSNINKDYRDLSDIDMSTTLLKYYNMNSDKIKVPSGYLLVTQFNKQSITTMDLGEMRKVVDYLNDIIEKMNVSKSETFLGFYVGSKERLQIQRATKLVNKLFRDESILASIHNLEVCAKEFRKDITRLKEDFWFSLDEFYRFDMRWNQMESHNEHRIRRWKSRCNEKCDEETKRKMSNTMKVENDYRGPGMSELNPYVGNMNIKGPYTSKVSGYPTSPTFRQSSDIVSKKEDKG